VKVSLNEKKGEDMSLFRLDASIRTEGSHSRAIADLVEQEWRNAHPGEPIVRRHIGLEPVPATTWASAVFANRTPAESRTDEQYAAQDSNYRKPAPYPKIKEDT
jgi:FMN-dependent NADH-azoreductase